MRRERNQPNAFTRVGEGRSKLLAVSFDQLRHAVADPVRLLQSPFSRPTTSFSFRPSTVRLDPFTTVFDLIAKTAMDGMSFPEIIATGIVRSNRGVTLEFRDAVLPVLMRSGGPAAAAAPRRRHHRFACHG